jgi:Lipoprotein amino terminal region
VIKSAIAVVTAICFVSLSLRSKADEAPRSDVQRFLEAYHGFSADKNRVTELGEKLVAEQIASDDLALSIGLLSSVATPEAQKYLVSYLNNHSAEREKAEMVFPHLALLSAPTQQTIEGLIKFGNETRDPLLAENSDLTLGAVFSHVKSDHPQYATLKARLQNLWPSDGDAARALHAVEVYGNAGSEVFLPHIKDCLKSPNLDIRTAAVFALRFIKGSNVTETLVDMASYELDERIRLVAKETLRYRRDAVPATTLAY